MTIRAILFDLDGTLWHSPLALPEAVLEARSARRVAPLLAAWDVSVDPIALCRALGEAMARALWEARDGALLSPDGNGILEPVARAAGLDLDDGQLTALWSAWRLNGAERGRQPYPDAPATLAWARASGYQLGLISNCFDEQAPLLADLAACGLGGPFEAVALSCEVGWLKPHPAIFSAALDQLGADAAATLMVGDNRRADIGGAKLLGMPAVWKRNGRRDPIPPDALPPDAVIDDLWELRRLPLLGRGSGADPTPRHSCV